MQHPGCAWYRHVQVEGLWLRWDAIQGDAVKAHCVANVVEDVGINPQVEAS